MGKVKDGFKSLFKNTTVFNAELLFKDDAYDSEQLNSELSRMFTALSQANANIVGTMKGVDTEASKSHLTNTLRMKSITAEEMALIKPIIEEWKKSADPQVSDLLADIVMAVIMGRMAALTKGKITLEKLEELMEKSGTDYTSLLQTQYEDILRIGKGQKLEANSKFDAVIDTISTEMNSTMSIDAGYYFARGKAQLSSIASKASSSFATDADYLIGLMRDGGMFETYKKAGGLYNRTLIREFAGEKDMPKVILEAYLRARIIPMLVLALESNKIKIKDIENLKQLQEKLPGLNIEKDFQEMFIGRGVKVALLSESDARRKVDSEKRTGIRSLVAKRNALTDDDVFKEMVKATKSPNLGRKVSMTPPPSSPEAKVPGTATIARKPSIHGELPPSPMQGKKPVEPIIASNAPKQQGLISLQQAAEQQQAAAAKERNSSGIGEPPPPPKVAPPKPGPRPKTGGGQ